MGNEQVRDLERRWQASGALSDEVAYLRARSREGSLSPEQLALAAAVGHKAALELAPIPLDPDPFAPVHPSLANDDPREPLKHWVAGLARWGPTAPLHAATVCCDLLTERVLQSTRTLRASIPAQDRERVEQRARDVLLRASTLFAASARVLAGGAEKASPEADLDARFDSVLERLGNAAVGNFFEATGITQLMQSACALYSLRDQPKTLWDPRETIERRERTLAGIRAHVAAGGNVPYMTFDNEILEVKPAPGMTAHSLACARVVANVADALTAPYSVVEITHRTWLSKEKGVVVAHLRELIRTRIVSLAFGLAPERRKKRTPEAENQKRIELLEHGTGKTSELTTWIEILDLELDPGQLPAIEAVLVRYATHSAPPVRKAAVFKLTRIQTPAATAALLACFKDGDEHERTRVLAMGSLASRGERTWLRAIPSLFGTGFVFHSLLSLLVNACGVGDGRLAPILDMGRQTLRDVGISDQRPASVDADRLAEWLCAQASDLEDAKKRRALMDTLCALGSPRCCQAFLRQIAVDTGEEQQVRIGALGNLCPSQSNTEVVLSLAEDADGGVQRTALKHFDSLPREQALARIHQLLPTEEDPFTLTVLLSLQSIRDLGSAQVLREFLGREDLSDYLRGEAKKLLGLPLS